MKGKLNTGMIILLLLAALVVITTTASAATTSYVISPSWSSHSVTVNYGDTLEYYYFPNAKVTKTFFYVSDSIYAYPHGNINFYYRNGIRDTWHLWRTAETAINPTVTQTIKSGSTITQFRFVFKSVGPYVMKGKFYLR